MDTQGYISRDEVRQALKQIYSADTETNLQSSLLECLSDGLKPIDEKGHWKPSPPLILTLALLFALLGVFVYFSIGGRG